MCVVIRQFFLFKFIFLFSPLFFHLVCGCGQTEVPDERGDFADFRRNVTEVMRDVVFVVGAVECFQKVVTASKASLSFSRKYTYM